MELKLKLGQSDPIAAESAVVVDQSNEDVFEFIADRFHENYPKWMLDVKELEPLDGVPIKHGSKVRQVRIENEEEITSVFEITQLTPTDLLSLQGIDMPYRQTYQIEAIGPHQSTITFRFELLEVELFMRPFVKLIRSAIEEGVESTTQTLQELLNHPEAAPASSLGE